MNQSTIYCSLTWVSPCHGGSPKIRPIIYITLTGLCEPRKYKITENCLAMTPASISCAYQVQA